MAKRDKRLDIRISEELLKILDTLCFLNGCSRSEMIRFLIENFYKNGVGTTTPPHRDQ